MNPLRILGDWLTARYEPDWQGFEPITEHERLMRHTGRRECPIADHADALRLLGRMTIDRDQWRSRALTAEARLRHPAQGDQAA